MNLETVSASHAMQYEEFTFSNLISPLDMSTFLSDKLGKSPVLVRGLPDRFSSLFTWADINETLASQRLDPNRTHVVQGGQSSALPLAEAVPQLGPRGRPLRLRPAALNSAMAAGAGLVIDAIEEAEAKLRRLTTDIERVLGSHAQANLYANVAGGSDAFGMHWDDHEVFVLQVEGEKQWEIYGLTMPVPLGGLSQPPQPREAPVQLTLRRGDLLYLPRGWWHRVTASAETAHLSIGIRLPTGIDVLSRLTKRAANRSSVRSDIPRDKTYESWLASLRADIHELLTADNVLEDIVTELLNSAPSRPHYALPLVNNESTYNSGVSS
jgi:ribosomal protein L16 Arg81 hydroxylase